MQMFACETTFYAVSEALIGYLRGMTLSLSSSITTLGINASWMTIPGRLVTK